LWFRNELIGFIKCEQVRNNKSTLT
jgi:hypothetical protein